MEIFINTFCYLQKGGSLLWFIALADIGIFFFFLKNWYQLRRALVPTTWKDSFLNRVAAGESFEKIKRSFTDKTQSFYTRMINYCIRRIQEGSSVFNIVEEVRSREVSGYERDILILSALVAAAPLLGLLGTVFGMMQTFDAIAQRSADTSQIMASGVSRALITTKFGLIAALPGIFGVTALRKQLSQLDLQFMNMEHHLSLALRKRELKKG